MEGDRMLLCADRGKSLPETSTAVVVPFRRTGYKFEITIAKHIGADDAADAGGVPRRAPAQRPATRRAHPRRADTRRADPRRARRRRADPQQSKPVPGGLIPSGLIPGQAARRSR
eukprot:3500221-Prymnesium_polylepis.1